LRNIDEPPWVLFAQGQLQHACWQGVAMVGSRNPTPQGKENARRFASQLQQSGCCIVSGLAMGIDSVAHEYSIKNNIPTVAVLGSGLNQVFPKRNTKLAQEILEHGGALLSEYSLFSKPVRENFPVRNRIVAGLSDATIVVESREKGGALITADLAND
jgi:DNA processing protein